MMEGFIALYIFMLAGFTGYEIISKVPFIAVILAAGNAVGGYVVTERMLEMFTTSKKDKQS